MNLKQYLETNSFEYLGIRGTYEPYQIGQELENSYNSSFEGDSYELDGTCVIKPLGVDETDFSFGGVYNYEVEETLEGLKKAIAYVKKAYDYKHIYLLGSNDSSNDDVNDDYEALLKWPVVLIKVN